MPIILPRVEKIFIIFLIFFKVQRLHILALRLESEPAHLMLQG